MARRLNSGNPMDYLFLALEQQKLMLAAMQTIWLRSGLMLAGAMTPVEATAMWAEKQTAFAKSFEQATRAAMLGKPVMKVARAALGPITAKASANARRLKR